MTTTLSRLRLTGLLEGISFLLLLGIAMPLKYIWGMPEAVSVVGMAHGVLWMLYLWFILQAQLEIRWPKTTSAVLVVASLLPFGPFIADARILKKLDTKESEPER